MSFNKKPKTINPDEVDPSVYYYDEVYDEMKEYEGANENRKDGSSKTKDRTSKYIQGLKETADLRKTEKELRKFKKFARDREEAEGDLDDGDVYVTAAYKKKLADMQKLEKDRRRQLEADADSSIGLFKAPTATNPSRKSNTEPQDQPTTSRSHSKAEDSPRHPSNEGKDTHKVNDSGEKSARRSLKTFDERREFLNEVLAKRTVGDVFDQAVLRYKARRAFKQH